MILVDFVQEIKNPLEENLEMNKMLKNLLVVASAVLVALPVFTGCSKDNGKKVVIKGSTTVLPITQKAAEAYRKNNKVSITIEGSGSGNGIKALLDGSTDIANASRAMKEKELKKAKEKGIQTKEIACALDMIVPVINPKNPVKNLSLTQLKAIYDGSITNWKQVGGKDAKIVVISRDTSSGTYEVWHKKVMKKTDVRKDALLQASNGAVASSVAGNDKAIGYVGYGYLNDTVKAISVDKVQPTIASGKSGKYPISRKLFMYINEKTISAEAKGFIDYILSAEGQKLVKEAGFLNL